MQGDLKRHTKIHDRVKGGNVAKGIKKVRNLNTFLYKILMDAHMSIYPVFPIFCTFIMSFKLIKNFP